MRTSMVALALILSSLALSQSSLAQTSKPVLQNFYQPVYVTAFIPCINGGKGENVTFSDTETELFWYSVTGGKRNGWEGGNYRSQLHSTGQHPAIVRPLGTVQSGRIPRWRRTVHLHRQLLRKFDHAGHEPHLAPDPALRENKGWRGVYAVYPSGRSGLQVAW